VPPLTAGAAAFRKRLRAVRRELPGIAWYPYDPLASLDPLREIELPVGAGPLADIGCADGDMAFFLESLGFEVDAIDNSAANHNGLRGARALREALGSRVAIHDIDLDTQFVLPRERYTFVFFLGILYHLKNPYYALETLARATSHMLLSTRVARVAGDGTPIHSLPVAYLLDARETNNDPTNYWIFSEAGLRRILDRAGWNVTAWTTTGCTGRSDPVTRDERAFYLLESRYASSIEGQLLHGWHAVEEGGWRWTERRFAVRPSGSGRTVNLTFTALQPVTLAVAIDGEAIPPQRFETGTHLWSREVPPGAILEFTVDRAMPAGADTRELALVVGRLARE